VAAPAISRRDLIVGSAASAAAVALGSPSAWATPQTNPLPILELFTSQGCSSCPVADALFETYAKRDDVLALTYSVDYWDYLGWRDTLASPRFTKRQRSYAKARGDGNIYTPQIVVNGLTYVTGSDQALIEGAMAQTAARLTKSWVPIQLRVDAATLVVDAPTTTRLEAEATVWLLVVAPRIEVTIKRGENAGRTISYFNVVRDITPIGMWNGSINTIRIERQSFVPANAGMLAVLLQHGAGGPIIGAHAHQA
jgi:hypothetical protein